MVWLELVWISLPEAKIQVIKVEHRSEILGHFALVHVQSCAILMEMNRDSVTLLLHKARFLAVVIAVCITLTPNMHTFNSTFDHCSLNNQQFLSNVEQTS